jgi:hypothetical protein
VGECFERSKGIDRQNVRKRFKYRVKLKIDPKKRISTEQALADLNILQKAGSGSSSIG